MGIWVPRLDHGNYSAESNNPASESMAGLGENQLPPVLDNFYQFLYIYPLRNGYHNSPIGELSMKLVANVAHLLVRITGLIQIVLGMLIWLGIGVTLIPIHILSGIILVVSLWVLAFVAWRVGVPSGQPLLAFLWGILVVVLGLTQGGLLSGPAHWVVQVVHLLVGLGAIGQAERLARQIGRREGTVLQM
jgi:hypothetical protein